MLFIIIMFAVCLGILLAGVIGMIILMTPAVMKWYMKRSQELMGKAMDEIFKDERENNI